MRKTLFIGLLLVVSLTLHAGEKSRYRSDKLEKMAVALSCNSSLGSLPDGEYDGFVHFEGIPVVIIKQNGIVEHIGFSCFSPEERALLGEYPCRFLERYTLECLLPLKREKTVPVQLLEDGVFFQQGDLWMLASHGRDTCRTCTVDLLAERRYVITWKGNGGKDGMVIFPASHELLLGRSMEENERRLPDEIREMVRTVPAALETESVAAREDGILVSDQGEYYLSSMRAVSYYRSSGEPLFSLEYPCESICNLLNGTIHGENVEILFRMRAYPLRNVYFQGTVSQLIAYGQKYGFIFYYGTIGLEEDSVNGILIMRNVGWGCNHVFRIQAPLSVIETGTGRIQAQMTPFVPTYHIRYLYEETAK